LNPFSTYLGQKTDSFPTKIEASEVRAEAPILPLERNIWYTNNRRQDAHAAAGDGAGTRTLNAEHYLGQKTDSFPTKIEASEVHARRRNIAIRAQYLVP
jgi:hypothetical protein